MVQKNKKKFNYNFIEKIKKQPQVLFVGLILAAVFFGLGGGYFLAKDKNNNLKQKPHSDEIVEEKNNNQEEDKDLIRRKLDGVFVDKEENAVAYPVAVMIENHWDARPQDGLSKANLVYEALVEGGITRFLAVYADSGKVDKMGPVRSARPYYLDWVSELDALYLHVGGSNEALEKIKQFNINDLNQFYFNNYFWRDHRRFAPHNVYTSGELINKALAFKGLDKKNNDFSSWLYKDDAQEEDRPDEKNIIIDYGSDAFLVNWKYDKQKNDYVRYMAGDMHKDKDGSEIRAKNIAVQYMNMRVIDEVGRKYFGTMGKGKAVVFFDGEKIEGTWRKKSRSDRTRFYNNEGREVEFNAGITWVEIVPMSYKVSINSK